jgi:hypothetical protein
LASIAITAPPTKTAYTVGDSLSTAGMVVTATYNNGGTKAVTNFTTKGFNSTAAGTQTVTVSYTEGDVTKTAAFTVTINPAILASIAITTPPAKTAYTVGESLSTAGMVVTATYNNGGTKAVTDYTTRGFNSTAAGTQTVTVSYTEGGITKTATFTVTINAATLSSIAIATPPTKTTYTVGESLSTAGMVVRATYSDGSSKAVTDYTTRGFNSSAAGIQTVTVSYTEGGITKTADFTVTINQQTGSLQIGMGYDGGTFTVRIMKNGVELNSGQIAAGITLSKSRGDSLTLIGPSGLTSPVWHVDNISYSGETRTLKAASLGVQSHSATFTGRRGAAYLSSSIITFTVTN